MSNSSEEPEFGGRTRLFPISEPDLETLEHDLPSLMEEMGEALNQKRNQVRWRRVMDVVQKVRWRYGPWTEVEVIPAGD